MKNKYVTTLSTKLKAWLANFRSRGKPEEYDRMIGGDGGITGKKEGWLIADLFLALLGEIIWLALKPTLLTCIWAADRPKVRWPMLLTIAAILLKIVYA